MSDPKHNELLSLLRGSETPSSDQFRALVQALDNHRILAKIFLLEGTPYVFKNSPMKYVIFREQVADQFDVGSQDVCIVGSAKLGYSPSPHRYGTPFAETSDVDVVVISDNLFDRGSLELFKELNAVDPPLHLFRNLAQTRGGNQDGTHAQVKVSDWRNIKEAIRNFVFQNFNPGRLPPGNPLRHHIFESISSTSGLFLALEPQVFVSMLMAV